jgi:hypothetical protein
MALMAGGVALLGVVSATLASWLVQKVSEAEVDGQAALVERLEQVVQDMHQIKDLLGPGVIGVHPTPLAQGLGTAPGGDIDESALGRLEVFLRQGFQAAQLRGDRGDELAWKGALSRCTDVRTSLEDGQQHRDDPTALAAMASP